MDGTVFNRPHPAVEPSMRYSLSPPFTNESVLPKYKWMAAYHDYVCRTFADDNSIGGDEGADSYEMAVEAEAQRVLDHLLLCEDQPAEQPFQPLRNYLKTQSEGIPPPS